jgi:hypothetical protein
MLKGSCVAKRVMRKITFCKTDDLRAYYDENSGDKFTVRKSVYSSARS